MNLRQTILSAALSLAPATVLAQNAGDNTTHTGTPASTPPPTPATNTGSTFPQARFGLELSSYLLGAGGVGITADPLGVTLPSTSQVISNVCLTRVSPANYNVFGNVNGRGLRLCASYGDNFSGAQRAGGVFQVRIMSLLDEAVAVDVGLQAGVLMDHYSPVGGYLGALITAGASVGRVLKVPALNFLRGELNIPIEFQHNYFRGAETSVWLGLGAGLGLQF